MPARPFLKWAGGKSQLLPELTSRLPQDFVRYHEPFVGGGAFFFWLWNTGRLRHGAVLSDYNPHLVDCYRVVRDNVEELIHELRQHHPHAQDKEYFYEIRNWDRQPGFAERSTVSKAARMIFINRTCYNGLYRLNKKGQFNAPFGYYKNPLIVDPENMRAVSAALQHVELRHGDFAAVLDQAGPGDFIYFDPPYAPVSPTASFTHYTDQGFTAAEQHRLAKVFRQLVEQGCSVMLSNSYTELTRDLYEPLLANLGSHVVRASRKINCIGTKRGFVDELIACSYPAERPVAVPLLAE